jgi:hypothetical protein
MDAEHFEDLRSNEVVRKRLAKVVARDCFRNTKLEDFHAGVWPSSETGDYSDVKVVSPYGEIPWRRMSRLSDAEMKELMIDVVDRCYDFLTLMFCTRKAGEVIEALKQRDPLPQWDEPVLRKR